jgi:hypothetical protein
LLTLKSKHLVNVHGGTPLGQGPVIEHADKSGQPRTLNPSLARHPKVIVTGEAFDNAH